MYDYKVVIGVISIIITFISYYAYIKDTIAGRTKPHIFSWFIWGLLSFIGFLAQLLDGAGPGSWVAGVTTIICFFIVFLAFKQGEKSITKSDIISFSSALVAIVIWYLTENPLYSVIIIILVDIFAFIPTFRKSYINPYEETLIQYWLSSLKHILAITALSNYTLITYLFPVSLIIMNTLLALLLVIRRKQVPQIIKQ